MSASLIFLTLILLGSSISLYAFVKSRRTRVACETARQKALARIKQQRAWDALNTFSNTKAKASRTWENAPSYFQYAKKQVTKP